MTIRAKFRCLEITTRYDGNITAKLAAVKREGKDSENSHFWKYSPNGECELTFYKECNVEVGSYYYIDLDRVIEKPSHQDRKDHPALWELSRRDENNSYFNIELSWYLTRADYSQPPPAGLISGRFKVGLSEDAVGAREGFKPTCSLWTVAFLFAEKSDQP